jgi:hypothetical protein
MPISIFCNNYLKIHTQAGYLFSLIVFHAKSINQPGRQKIANNGENGPIGAVHETAPLIKIFRGGFPFFNQQAHSAALEVISPLATLPITLLYRIIPFTNQMSKNIIRIFSNINRVWTQRIFRVIFMFRRQ